MRVTGNMLASNLLSNLYGNLKHLNKYQNQISSNSRILRLSDDPIGAVSSIQIGNDILKNEQYSKNISDAKSWLDQTEEILSEMNDIMIRMKEISVQAGNGTYSLEQRDAINEEVKQMKDHFLELANTKFAGKYIFGGYNTTTAPFDIGSTVSYNSIVDISAATPAEITHENAQIRQYKISSSTTFDVSVSGLQLVGTGADNIFSIFEGFSNELNTNVVTPQLIEYSSKFSKAQDSLLNLVADVGGRLKRLEHMETRYENEAMNLSELHKKVAGINEAEVITHYKMAENTYNAALQVGAQIIQRSLLDFLR